MNLRHLGVLCYCPLSPFPKPLLLWSDSVACHFACAFPPTLREGGPSISSAVREAERPLLEPRVRVCLLTPLSAAAQGLKVYISNTALNLKCCAVDSSSQSYAVSLHTCRCPLSEQGPTAPAPHSPPIPEPYAGVFGLFLWIFVPLHGSYMQ